MFGLIFRLVESIVQSACRQLVLQIALEIGRGICGRVARRTAGGITGEIAARKSLELGDNALLGCRPNLAVVMAVGKRCCAGVRSVGVWSGGRAAEREPRRTRGAAAGCGGLRRAAAGGGGGNGDEHRHRLATRIPASATGTLIISFLRGRGHGPALLPSRPPHGCTPRYRHRLCHPVDRCGTHYNTLPRRERASSTVTTPSFSCTSPLLTTAFASALSPVPRDGTRSNFRSHR